MTYHSRIVADPVYLRALGQAFHNFTCLEWTVVWTIVKLSSDGFGSVPKGQPASKIAKALTNAIEGTSPPLPEDLRRRLVKFDQAYREAIRHRNKLLHAHPYTAPTGAQQLGGGGHGWPIEAVDAAAKLFEDAAIKPSHSRRYTYPSRGWQKNVCDRDLNGGVGATLNGHLKATDWALFSNSTSNCLSGRVRE